MGSPVPQEVLEELQRVVGRWHQLPLDHAFSRMPHVRLVVQQLAALGARLGGRPAQPVPELGPAAVMNQLTVMVHDVFAAQPDADPAPVADALVALRRSL